MYRFKKVTFLLLKIERCYLNYSGLVEFFYFKHYKSNIFMKILFNLLDTGSYKILTSVLNKSIKEPCLNNMLGVSNKDKSQKVSLINLKLICLSV